MLISEIARREPKRPQNHFTFFFFFLLSEMKADVPVKSFGGRTGVSSREAFQIRTRRPRHTHVRTLSRAHANTHGIKPLTAHEPQRK